MIQKLKFLAIIFILTTTLVSCTKAAQTKPPDALESTVIEFKNGQYNPSKITIKQNQKVTFVNQSDQDIWPASNIHPTHSIYPEFDPQKPVKPGQSWSFTFTKAGIWRFHDHLSPEITGTITVE